MELSAVVVVVMARRRRSEKETKEEELITSRIRGYQRGRWDTVIVEVMNMRSRWMMVVMVGDDDDDDDDDQLPSRDSRAHYIIEIHLLHNPIEK